MAGTLRAVFVGMTAGCLLYLLAGFKNQESGPQSWSISDEPTVQLEVTEEGKILVDPHGYLWVRTPFIVYRGARVTDEGFEPGGPRGPGMRAWDVFDSSGERGTGFGLPPDLTVQTIGENYILGTWTDADGKEYVRTYLLDRGG